MKTPEKCIIEYCGYNSPESPDELEFEFLGLQSAINEINRRIGLLKQTALLVQITIKEQNDNSDSEKEK